MSAARRQKGRRKKGQGATPSVDAAAKASARQPTGLGVLYIPLVLAFVIFVLSLVPRVQGNPQLVWSFWGGAWTLIVWQAVLLARLKREGFGRSLESVLRPQHYVQAMVQLAIFAYWGWHWRPVYDFGVLLFAQLLFAYAFDMLLTWSRRERYTLGFGPFPIIFSINLFLWFRDDWFYLQFLMVGIGFLGKEFVRWNRDGRSVHIFNPSAFSLGLFSLVLIATGTTHLTWGQDIASTLTLAPMIYLYLFVLGLVVMYFFSITFVAASAAVTLFGLSALYGAATGVPYFLDSEIPAAVFLGLHLLITDPSTSPRTPSGKLVFGALYGASVFGLYAVLGAAGAPTFYDKLLAVPLLNLSVRGIDSFVRALKDGPLANRLIFDVPALRTNLAHMAIWIVFFGAMAMTGRTDGRHTGDSLPFWEEACSENLPNACERLIQLESTYCGDSAAWACNELGGHYMSGDIVALDRDTALGYFARSCELKFQAACLNLLEPGTFARTDPRPLDLRLMLREGGLNLLDMPEPELYERACEHEWAFACVSLASTI
jgi:hypothetical protein